MSFVSKWFTSGASGATVAGETGVAGDAFAVISARTEIKAINRETNEEMARKSPCCGPGEINEEASQLPEHKVLPVRSPEGWI